MCCVNARPDGVAFRCRSNASDEGTASVTVPTGEGGSFKAKQSERGSGVNEYAICCCILFLNPACSPEKARGGERKNFRSGLPGGPGIQHRQPPMMHAA